MSHSLLRDLIDRVRRESNGLSKEPFSIIIDETTDITRSEQVSFCLRFCNNKMQSEEVFLGFHKTSRTDAETLFNLVKSSLMSFGLSLSGVRGQAYDGASNMAGRQAVSRQRFSLKILRQSISIALDTNQIWSIPEVALALVRMNAVVHFIRNSPKKLDKFKDMVAQVEVGEIALNNHNLRPLCPTRWVMRLPAVDSFLEHYASILEYLETLKEDATEPSENRATADSFLQNLETFLMYFSLRVVQKLLHIVHPIHTMCQGRRVTTGDVRRWVNTTTLSLSAEANMINANLLYDAMKKVTLKTLHLDMPALPRAKRARACLSTAATTEEHKHFT